MKRICNLLLLLAFALLLFSCAPDIDSNRTDARIILNGKVSRSITPVYPEVDEFDVKIEGPETQSVTVKNDETVAHFDNVLMGEYLLTVEGKENGNVVMRGEKSITINPKSTTFEITLSFLSEGTGVISIPISWSDASSSSELFKYAVESKSLGFQAFWSKSGDPVSDIKWVTDFSTSSYTYEVDGIEKTEGENIFFRIYTKLDGYPEPVAVARSFDTVVTVYPNLTSVPDSNEKYNFIISSNTVRYIFNVIGAKTEPMAGSEETALTVTWSYPAALQKRSGSVYVTLIPDEGERVTQKVGFDKVSSSSCNFEGLSPERTYSLSFRVVLDGESDAGISEDELLLENQTTLILVKTVQIDNLADEYVMGDSVELSVKMLPENADDKTYTVIGEGLEITGNKITFPSSGKYTVTVKANKGEASATKSVNVILSSPSDFIAEKANEGIQLSWGAVEGASSYKITRTAGDEVKVFESISGTSCTDKDNIRMGRTYLYEIQAIHSDADLNSKNVSAEVEIPAADITVNLPDNFTSSDIVSSIKEINNKVLREGQPITLSIEGEYESVKWLINGVDVTMENPYELVISTETEGLNDMSAVTENTLTLIVDNLQSAPVPFLYETVISEAEISDITASGDVSKLVLGTTISLDAVISDGTSPVIKWESLNPEVIEVDKNGVVSAVDNGKGKIKATIDSNGNSKEIEITTYIPATRIEITNNSNGRTYLFNSKNGVTIASGYSSLSFSARGVRDDGLTVTDPSVTWSSDNKIITVSNGDVSCSQSTYDSSLKEVKLTASNADSSADVLIHVHDFDLYLDGAKSTGGSKDPTGGVFSENDYPMEIKANCSCNEESFTTLWCFDGISNKVQLGDLLSTLTIKNASGFTATLGKGSYTGSGGNMTVILYDSEVEVARYYFHVD